MNKKNEIESKKNEYKTTNRKLPACTNSLDHYLAEISNYPVSSREEEYELAMKYKKTGDLEAARKLINSNLKFVVRIAYGYKNYGINLMDIIQEGNIGLMHAVKGFDPTKGYRLISYAVWWIRAYIQNYVIKTWSLVKVGTSQAQRKLFYKLRSTKNELGIKDRNITNEDYRHLAQKLGVRNKDVKEMELRMGGKDFSLDSEISTDKSTTHLDFLVDEKTNQEDLLLKAEEEENVKMGLDIALHALKDRERHIIQSRILSENPQTLEELGSELNISRERVRQIENTALKKLKKTLEKRDIHR